MTLTGTGADTEVSNWSYWWRLDCSTPVDINLSCTTKIESGLQADKALPWFSVFNLITMCVCVLTCIICGKQLSHTVGTKPLHFTIETWKVLVRKLTLTQSYIYFRNKRLPKNYIEHLLSTFFEFLFSDILKGKQWMNEPRCPGTKCKSETFRFLWKLWRASQ